MRFSISKLLLMAWIMPSLGAFIDTPSSGAPGGGGGQSTVTPPPGSPAGAQPAPATAPVVTAPPSGASPASPTGTVPPITAPNVPPVGTPPVVPGPNDANIEILRQSHETLKGLGDLNAVRDGLGVYQKTWTEAQTLGRELDYTEASLQAAFKADPVGTVALLRQEAATHRATPEYRESQRIADLVREQTKPLNDYIARQQADRHNAAIDGEFNRMFTSNEAFKARNGVDAPAEVRGIIHDRFIETIKWNQDLIKEVIAGKMSGLQKVFDEVVTDTLGGWNKYNAWGQPTNGGGGGQPQPAAVRGPNGQFITPPAGTKPPPTLDQIIEGALEADVLPSMRGFK